ncbi:hypothetical protein NL676_007135 [Syzygium grande]|nr:hypothetical protein NL676_007135 [Syzygium grande]
MRVGFARITAAVVGTHHRDRPTPDKGLANHRPTRSRRGAGSCHPCHHPDEGYGQPLARYHHVVTGRPT